MFEETAGMFAQVEHLKTLLLSDSSKKAGGDAGGSVEPDLATALVHSVEEERDELRLRQAELSHTLKQLEAENAELQTTIGTLREALLAAEGHSQSVEEEVKVCKSPPDSVGESIAFSGCPSAAFFCSFVPPDRSC